MIGVNFGGYHAEAGLGGLLTGNAAHGGLIASAGTPSGQSAVAGLGGNSGRKLIWIWRILLKLCLYAIFILLLMEMYINFVANQRGGLFAGATGKKTIVVCLLASYFIKICMICNIVFFKLNSWRRYWC